MTADNTPTQRGRASFADRIDPSGRYRKSVADAEPFRHGSTRAFFEMLGVPREAMDQLVESAANLEGLIDAYERWAPLTHLGWAITDLAGPVAYDRAAQMLADGDPEASEEVLEEYWNQPDKLELTSTRILRTAIWTEKRIEVGHARHACFEEAVASHRAGHYAAALGIVLPHMDAMVREVDLPSPYSQPSKLVDDVTPGGHPAVLKVIYEIGKASVKKTRFADSRFPLRHGIVHGRLLAYGTRRNSTKAFVAAAELATFCQAQIEAAHADGRLDQLDRKVFA